LAISPAAASAATEFGDNCAGDAPVPTYTLMTISTPDASLPLAAPVGGVLTKVKMKISYPLPITLPEEIKVLRPAGVNNYTVTSQAAIQAGSGETVADVRMPIQANDRLGVRGLPFTYEGSPQPGAAFYCNSDPGVLGAFAGDAAPGSTVEFAEATEGRVPLRGVIEPDTDNDGYGDETQDGCPQSGAVQSACPLIALDTSAKAGKKAVVVLVTGSSEGPVNVKGVVKLGKGKKATLKAKAKTVFPGKLASFRLKFNAKLIKRLKELEPSQKLTLKITASATNVAGQVSTDKLKVKLKGQG